MRMKFKKPYRIRKKKSIFRNRFFWLGIFILIITGSIVYLLIFSQIFQIKELQISGNQKVQKGDLESFVWEKVNRKIVAFPTKSIFLVNISGVKQNLLEKFPKISESDIKRKFPDILILSIQERKPLYIFCKNSGPCFYLDEEGVIFDPVRNNISNGVEEISEIDGNFLKIQEKRPQEIYLSKEVIEDKLLQGIKEIEGKLREIGISIKELILFEEKIEVKTGRDFEIYFNPTENISNQIQNLSLTLEKEIPPEKRGNLEYIDLRFGNKVYYKYRE